MISCIVTTYNRPVETLKRAIDSIVNQTYKDIELIVVNDAPDNRGLAGEIESLLGQYEVPHKYIVHDKNMGACAARNTGIGVAQGEYVAFLDDDDEWEQHKLEFQIRKMTKPQVALVYCAHTEILQNGGRKCVKVDSYQDDLPEAEKMLKYGNYIGSTSYPLLRKEVFERCGMFTVGLKSSQDFDMWLRIAEKYEIDYCPEYLVNYYVSEESISKNPQNRKQGYDYLLDKYMQFYKKNKDAYNCRLNSISIAFLKMKCYKLFFYYWFKAISVKIFSRHNLMLFEKMFSKIVAPR